jgi:hypothetical protein
MIKTFCSSFWHYYCIFFHFNPAGFLFLHFMLILVLAAMIHEFYQESAVDAVAEMYDIPDRSKEE